MPPLLDTPTIPPANYIIDPYSDTPDVVASQSDSIEHSSMKSARPSSSRTDTTTLSESFMTLVSNILDPVVLSPPPIGLEQASDNIPQRTDTPTPIDDLAL